MSPRLLRFPGKLQEIDGNMWRKRKSRKACKRALLPYVSLLSERVWVAKSRATILTPKGSSLGNKNVTYKI